MLSLWLIVGLDWILKDPQWLYHPVQFFGFLIQTSEKWIRLKQGDGVTRFSGVLLVLSILAFVWMCHSVILLMLARIHPVSVFLYKLYLGYSLLAAGALMEEGRRIYKVLSGGDLLEARRQLSYLVSRDTADLSKEDLIRGAIETLSENITDGIVSPLFYWALFGIEGMLVFKVISTFDSMIGYKNTKYLHLGWFAARFDDVLNYIPARLAAVLVVISAGVLGLDSREGWRIFLRDHRKHASPNSACTESAVAGALHISLGGPSIYFGQTVDKPVIGDGAMAQDQRILQDVNRLIGVSTLLMAALVSFYLWLRG